MSVCRKISDLALASIQSPSCDTDMAHAKRARTDVRSFAEISVDELKLRCAHQTDKPVSVRVPLGDFNLTPSGWLSSKFGFDLNPKYGKPSFLGGEKPEKSTSESLSMRIALDAETSTFFKQLDEKVSREYLIVQKAEWQSIVYEDSLFNGGSSIKVHVILTGAPLTKLTVVANGKVDRGEGWEFLKDYLDKKVSFCNSEVKVCLRPRSVWYMDGKAGLSFDATRIVLRLPVDVDPFGNDDELLA